MPSPVRRRLTVVILAACAVPWLMSLGACSGEEELALVQNGELIVTPDVLPFNAQAVGEESVQYLTLTNVGQATVVVSALDLNTRSEEFGIASVDLPLRLAPGQERVLEAYYTPTDCELDRGSLTVVSNDRDQPEITVQLQPQDLGGQVQVSPSPVDFGRVPANSAKTVAVTLQNTGTCALEVNDLFLTGSGEFSMTEPAGDGVMGYVPELPFEIGPGASTTLDITFAPINDGYDEATLIVRSDDARRRNVDTPVFANGAAPCIVVTDEDGIDYGARFIGATHPKTITITNCNQRQPLEVYRIDLGVHATLGGTDTFSLQDTPDLTTPALLEPGASLPFTLVYAPIHHTPATHPDCTSDGCEVVDGATLTITSNDTVKTPLDIEVRGVGTNNLCPVAVGRARVRGTSGPYDTQLDTIPLATLEFDSSGSSDADGGLGSILWEVAERPDGSTQGFSPSAAVANPTFFLDLAGRYVFSLRVYDDTGIESCEPAIITAIVTPNEDIHVQTVWNTNNTDIDLHFMRAGSAWDSSADCHWKSTSPNWGASTTNDDPSLDIDDVDGFGPENINLDNPESTLFHVGLYYYSDHGQGPTDVTLRIYIGGVERFANTVFGFTNHQFWHVADIAWPSADITRINRIFPNGFP